MAGNIYKRGAVWWGRVTVAGVEHKRSLHTGARAEAERRVKEWMQEVGEARFYGQSRPSYMQAVVRWEQEYLPRAIKPSSASRYKTSLRQLGPHFESMKLHEIKVRTIADYVSERIKAGVTGETIKRDLSALSRLFSCCVGWGWMENNPARQFDRSILKEPKPLPSLPMWSDIVTVIQDAPPMMGRLLLCLYQSGMRLEECASQQHKQMDLAKKETTLLNTKSGQPRRVPLSPGFVETIKTTPTHIKGGWVFWHAGETWNEETGRIESVPLRYRNLPTNLSKIIRRCKKTFRVHDLRHRFAVDALARGVELYPLQKIMGHSSVKVTEGYLRYKLLPEEWPHAKSLYEMSYAEVMGLSQNTEQKKRISGNKKAATTT